MIFLRTHDDFFIRMILINMKTKIFKKMLKIHNDCENRILN